MEWFGSDGTLKIILFQLPCHGPSSFRSSCPHQGSGCTRSLLPNTFNIFMNMHYFYPYFYPSFFQELGEHGFNSDRVSAALAPGKRYNHKNNNKKREFIVIKSSSHHICATTTSLSPYPKASQFSSAGEVDEHRAGSRGDSSPEGHGDKSSGVPRQETQRGHPCPAQTAPTTQHISLIRNKEKLGAGGAGPDPELILPTNVHSSSFTGTRGMSGDL